jgi:hypothetical protein
MRERRSSILSSGWILPNQAPADPDDVDALLPSSNFELSLVSTNEAAARKA